MANPWFKFYGGEYLSDQKIGNLTAQERSCLITLFSLASISSIPGEIEFLTTEILLEKSGVHFDPYDTSEWDNCLAVLDKFERLKIIKKTDGFIVVLNWEKRQEHNLTNAERQAKYRENRKSNEKVTDDVTKVTLDKNRIDKNREDKEEEVDKSTNTPKNEAVDFFKGGETYKNIYESLILKTSPEIVDRELKKFVLYWTEKNKSGTKQRWEQQPTFEVKRRLYTWFSKNREFTNQIKKGKQIV